MGFMDKAKQMAEQAQKKIDDAQKQFNESQSAKSGEPAEGAQRFDEHGRPVGGAPAPVAETPSESAPETPPEPASEEPVEQPPVKEGVDANPDPFKPLQ